MSLCSIMGPNMAKNGRRTILTALLSAWLLGPVQAQDGAKPRRVGWIAIPSEELFRRQGADVVRAAFAELGYQEGKNLILDMRFAAGRFERGPELAKELLESAAEVLVTAGFHLSVAALQVTKTVPVVGAGCGLEQLVESLARPGGNFTGMTCPAWELGGKQLQLLSELLPGERQLAALVDPKSGNAREVIGDLKRAAADGKFAVHLFAVHRPEEIEAAFGEIARLGARGVVVAPSSVFWAHRQRVIAAALAHRVPIVTIHREFTNLGGLLSYGHSYRDVLRGAVGTVDKILQGAKPADLPMQRPIKFELIVNLKTARELGLTIPPSILLRADEVIE